MKQELSKFEKALIWMMKTFGQGKPFWFFPKPVMVEVKASPAPPWEGRKWLQD